MTTTNFSKIFIIGGTGAQGLPIIKSLVSDSKYACRVLTRDTSSPRAKSLEALGNVELFGGTFTSESDLRKGYAGCDAAFVNIDGFNTGEMAEIFWAIRCYELAVENGGIKFFVYGNLDYVYRESGYRHELRAGHYDGKGRIGEWILFQAREAAKRAEMSMGVALFTTGPYIEMAISSNTTFEPTIEQDESGEEMVTWRVPLGKEGAVAHVALDVSLQYIIQHLHPKHLLTSTKDCGYYVRWLFDHPSRTNGMNLKVAIDHSNYDEVAAAFTRATGRPARCIEVSYETYFREGALRHAADRPTGYSADPNDPATMRIRENFTAFWEIWRASGGNKGVVKRDYELLDKIHPKRIRSVEEWFRYEDDKGRKNGLGTLWERLQKGKLKPVLKLHEDGFRDPRPKGSL
jgi:hypothetical protein